MHEFYLAQGLMGQVRELAALHGAVRVTRVRVRIGPWAGVVPDSFRFGFEALASAEPLTQGAELELELPPRCWRCGNCGFLIEGQGPPGTCPGCDGGAFHPLGGIELTLMQVEMEQEEGDV